MILPSKQVGKSQRCAARLPVQPDTEIVPGGLGRQPSLKALEEESEVTVHWGSALFMHLRAGTETMGDIIATTNLILETLAAGTYTVEVISRAARPFILVFSGLEMPEDPPEPPPEDAGLLVAVAAGAGQGIQWAILTSGRRIRPMWGIPCRWMRSPKSLSNVISTRFSDSASSRRSRSPESGPSALMPIASCPLLRSHSVNRRPRTGLR